MIMEILKSDTAKKYAAKLIRHGVGFAGAAIVAYGSQHGVDLTDTVACLGGAVMAGFAVLWSVWTGKKDDALIDHAIKSDPTKITTLDELKQDLKKGGTL